MGALSEQQDREQDMQPAQKKSGKEEHTMPRGPIESGMTVIFEEKQVGKAPSEQQGLLSDLEKIGLQSYAQVLDELGVEKLSDLVFVTDGELEKLGMKLVHRRKLRAL